MRLHPAVTKTVVRNAIVLIAFLWGGVIQAGEDAAVEADPARDPVSFLALIDSQYTTLKVDGLDYNQAAEKFRSGAEALRLWIVWEDHRRREFRRLGLQLWHQHPRDPARAQWLARTIADPPFFWKDEQQGTTAVAANRVHEVIVDLAQRLAWERQYMVLRADCMVDPEIQPEVKSFIRTSELGDVAGSRAGPPAPDVLLALHGARTANAVWDLYAGEQLIRTEGMGVVSAARALLAQMESEPGMQEAFVETLRMHPNPALNWLGNATASFHELRRLPFELEGADFDGRTVRVQDLRGKVVLLDLWSNNCGSCIEMMPGMQRLHEKYRDRGFEVVGVWFDSSTGTEGAEKERVKARGLLKKQGVTYSNVALIGKTAEEFKDRYAIVGFPVTWLLDRSGHMVATRMQPSNTEAEVQRVLELAR